MTRKEIVQSPEYWVNLMEIPSERIKEILTSSNPKLTVLELAKISTKLGLAPKITFTKLNDGE